MDCLHDEANIKQTSSKQAIRAHVVHVYFEYICLMFVWSCKRGIISHSRFFEKATPINADHF